VPNETKTPEPDETKTPDPDETKTPEPDENKTPDPDETKTPDPTECDGGGGSGGDDFSNPGDAPNVMSPLRPAWLRPRLYP